MSIPSNAVAVVYTVEIQKSYTEENGTYWDRYWLVGEFSFSLAVHVSLQSQLTPQETADEAETSMEALVAGLTAQITDTTNYRVTASRVYKLADEGDTTWPSA